METGKWLNGVKDKRVWLKWMELRSHNNVGAIETPVGNIPKYNDLKKLFKNVMKKDFTPADYTKQFTIRVPQNVAKIDRIVDIYKNKVKGTPQVVFEMLAAEKDRLLKMKEKHGDFVSPEKLV